MKEKIIKFKQYVKYETMMKQMSFCWRGNYARNTCTITSFSEVWVNVTTRPRYRLISCTTSGYWLSS